MARTVTLVLVDSAGAPLGVLPPFAVDFPYWPEVADIVAGARERYGVEVAVLRLLTTEPGARAGGAVSYLAEAAEIPPRYAGPVTADLSPHPLRAAYAFPGGPADSLRWAAEALDRVGRGPVTSAVQRKTWNLSATWRLETPSGPVWLKQVPPFFRHEAAVLQWIGDSPYREIVPALLAADGGRMLLEHIPGGDLYDAGTDLLLAIASAHHRLQYGSAEHVDTLLSRGVPDLRTDRLVDALTAVVARHGNGDEGLDALVAGLPDRMSTVDGCGLPATLVHGDLHSGNVAGDANVPGDANVVGDGTATRRAIIDWGDSFIGHPAFDIIRLAERSSTPDTLFAAWSAQWRAAVPGSDPDTAIRLLRPVAALRNALAYATFLDDIEPSEHPYHEEDVPFWLSEAVRLAEPRGAEPSTAR